MRRVQLALKSLAAAVTAEVHDLAGKVYLGLPGPETAADYPSLSLVPGPLRFVVDQAREHALPDASTLIDEVGSYEGPVQLRLAAEHGPQRERLEEAILDLFFTAARGRRGVLVTGPIAEYHGARCSFEVDSREWTDEMVFSAVRDTLLTVQAHVPYLVRRAVPTIETLHSAVNHDLASDLPLETLRVLEDGTLSAVA